MLNPAKQVRGLGKAGLLPSRAKRPTVDSPKTSHEDVVPILSTQKLEPSLVPSHGRVLPQAQPTRSQEGNTGHEAEHPPVTYPNIAATATTVLIDKDDTPASSGHSAGGMGLPTKDADPLGDSENEAQGQLVQPQSGTLNQPVSRPARRKRTLANSAGPSEGDQDAAPPTHAAKRAKKTKTRRSSGNKAATVDVDLSDILGQAVEVPGAIFYVTTPGVFYIGDVIKPEPKHRNAVEVVFQDDGSRYWFPAKDVRKWLMEQREREDDFARCTSNDIVDEMLTQEVDNEETGPGYQWPAAFYGEAPASVVPELEQERLAAQALTDISAGISGASLGAKNGKATYSDTAANQSGGGGVGRGNGSKGTSRLRNAG